MCRIDLLTPCRKDMLLAGFRPPKQAIQGIAEESILRLDLPCGVTGDTGSRRLMVTYYSVREYKKRTFHL